MERRLYSFFLALLLLGFMSSMCAQNRKPTTRARTAKTQVNKRPATPASAPKPVAVNMGLKVMWSNIDLGAPSTTSPGKLYSPKIDVESILGRGWRSPSWTDFMYLFNNCTKRVILSNGKPTAIVFTSKITGEKIYFRIPKISLVNRLHKNGVSNPLFSEGKTFYQLFYKDYGLWVCNMTKAERDKLFNVVVKYSDPDKPWYEWSASALEAIGLVDAVTAGLSIASDHLEWMGNAITVDEGYDSYWRTRIRPVYDPEIIKQDSIDAEEHRKDSIAAEKHRQDSIEGNIPLEVSEVEEPPQFPGGPDALRTFIRDNKNYPKIALENGIGGRVFVKFVVGKDGSISNVVVASSVDASLDKEAVRVVKSMPNWIPGKIKGKPVPVIIRQSVNFSFY